jgi:hypothetical protein
MTRLDIEVLLEERYEKTGHTIVYVDMPARHTTLVCENCAVAIDIEWLDHNGYKVHPDITTLDRQCEEEAA